MDFLDDNWSLLTEITHKVIKEFNNKSELTHIEAFFTGTQSIQVSIRDSDIQGQNKVFDFGVGFGFGG